MPDVPPDGAKLRQTSGSKIGGLGLGGVIFHCFLARPKAMSITTIAALDKSQYFFSPLALEPDLAELVEIFVADLPARLAEIQHFVQIADWAEARRLAHQLKGAGGSYGFPHLSAAALALEQAVKRATEETAEPGIAVTEALQGLAQACDAARSGQGSV